MTTSEENSKMGIKMTVKVLLVAIVVALAPGRPALAHEGHDRPRTTAISEETAKVRAKEEVVRLIADKKIDATWKDATIKSTEKKTYKDRWEWLVTLENPKVKEKATLYVFLKPSGAFVAANFTGK